MSTEKYDNLGGIYFPILQQDGVTRVLTKIGAGNPGDLIFLKYLRQHDRKQEVKNDCKTFEKLINKDAKL